MSEPAYKIAEAWYRVDEIQNALKWTSPAFGERMGNTVPEDVRSREFAEWLTEQYRLAMSKGIDLGRAEKFDKKRRAKT